MGSVQEGSYNLTEHSGINILCIIGNNFSSTHIFCVKLQMEIRWMLLISNIYTVVREAKLVRLFLL